MFARSEPVSGDKTLLAVPIDLSGVGGAPVRFRFHLRKGRLYAFWVSADPAGASGGSVAAGGPAFAGRRDLPR